MKQKIELLAPGGNISSIKSAIIAGANAVYCGLNKFNARNRADNISFEDLQGILRLAHTNDCEVFLTLNIIIVDSEVPALVSLLNKLVNTSIDGVIVQDIGLFYILAKHFPSLRIHASTQVTTHNKGQIEFLSKIGAERVNLSRELSIKEITELTSVATDNNMLTEVFVHGSYCISFSGACYMSSVHGGNSGNRGRCSQPCRDRFVTTPAGVDFPLNMKDNSSYFNLEQLYNAGVYSLKVEGRIKEFEYVYTVIDAWRKQIDSFYNGETISDDSALRTVFNRDFSDGFLKGEIGKEMFIDDPRTQSTKRLLEASNNRTGDDELIIQKEHFKRKDEIKLFIESEIAKMDIGKVPLKIELSGSSGSPLSVSIKLGSNSFNIVSKQNLSEKGNEPLGKEAILKTLNPIKDTEFYIEDVVINFKPKLYLSFKELNAIKKEVLVRLNGSKELVAPIELPKIKRHFNRGKPALSVIISSVNDVELCDDNSVDIYFELPNSIGNSIEGLIELFTSREQLIPVFPAILIGEDYDNAVELLRNIKTQKIVTNNTGIAYEAFKFGMPWIAGAQLNIANSYSLIGLKEKFGCKGAFISNEISKYQIKGIKKPDDFELYYSIYHPIVLMTSRQCLFHQITGCKKGVADESCIGKCSKYATITDLKGENIIVEKSKGNYHRLYNSTNLLNTDIVTDIPNLFTGYSIDLRDIKTDTQTKVDKATLIDLFKKHIGGDSGAAEKLKSLISHCNNSQYKKGI